MPASSRIVRIFISCLCVKWKCERKELIILGWIAKRYANIYSYQNIQEQTELTYALVHSRRERLKVGALGGLWLQNPHFSYCILDCNASICFSRLWSQNFYLYKVLFLPRSYYISTHNRYLSLISIIILFLDSAVPHLALPNSVTP